MDDELKQLEAELEQLRPAAPSPALVARVGREIAQPPAQRPPADVRWIWAAALSAAAAVALVFTQFSRERGSQVAPPDIRTAALATPSDSVTGAADSVPLKPVTAENILVSAADEGLVTLEDGSQGRRERLQFVDTITWKNPRTNASLTWRVPREEVRVVPVSFQ